MKLLSSDENSKKYSSGFSSLLTLQDSDGEILQDSSGVVVGEQLRLTKGIEQFSSKGSKVLVVGFWRSF